MLRSILSVLLIILVFSGCSSVTDKEIYDLAKQKYDQGNYPETLQEYEKLIKEFPDTEYRSEVLFEIGKLYHGQVVKSLTKEQNFNRAITHYKKVYTEFPQNSEAQNSLFMVGFLFANELKELDSAKYYYSKFIETYPENEMVVSAKAEIENLGIAAEEILKRNENTE
jgi:TolA-binding protein